MSDALIDDFVESVVYIGGDADWHRAPKNDSETEEKSGTSDGSKKGWETRRRGSAAGPEDSASTGQGDNTPLKFNPEWDYDGAKLELEAHLNGEFIGQVIAIDDKVDGVYSVRVIGVRPEFRRRGYATQLYREAARLVHERGGKLQTGGNYMPEGKLLSDAMRKRGVFDKHGTIKAAKALTETLWELDDWLTEKSGTSEGAKLGWDHREHGGMSGSEKEGRAEHMDAAVAALELHNAHRKAADRLVAAKLAFGTGQYKTSEEYAARKKELKEATEQEADLAEKRGEARRKFVAMPLYGKSEWSEEKHPRDESGKFGEKGSGAAPAVESDEPDNLEARGAHIESRIKELLQQGQDTLSLHDKVNGMMGAYTPQRQKQHEQIIDDIMQENAHVKTERRAVISGGLTGAGKTSTLTSDVGKNNAGVDPNEYITINPDNMKEELLKRGMMPEYEGLNPGEAAWMVHEESSKLAWDLHYRAAAAGKNVIWDMTMSSASGVEQRLNKLNEAGYKVKLVYVHTTIETSIRRSDERYKRGLEENPKTARYVAHPVITNQHDPEHGTKNRKAFEAVKNRASDGWFLFDNNGDAPKLISRSE